MPAPKFFLDAQKTQQVEISWRLFWKDITVKYNGTVIGSFQNLAHLKQGETFQLPDGSPLRIYYSTAYGEQGIRIEHNGRPLKGTAGDPATRLKGIFSICIFIGALNILIGTLGEFADIQFLREMGAGWLLIVIGAIVIGLGYCVHKYRSVPALIAVIALMVIDIIAYLIAGVAEGGRPGFGGIAFKVFFIIFLVRGFGAIRDLKETEMFGEHGKRSPFL